MTKGLSCSDCTDACSLLISDYNLFYKQKATKTKKKRNKKLDKKAMLACLVSATTSHRTHNFLLCIGFNAIYTNLRQELSYCLVECGK